MFTDAQLMYSDAQALSATAVSTNVVDHSSDRDLGIGEPMAIVITADVGLAGTTPTLVVTLQTDDNQGFSSAATVIATASTSTLPTGGKLVLPIPPDTAIERFTRLNYTLGGTTPTVTLTAFMQPMAMIQGNNLYADAITIS